MNVRNVVDRLYSYLAKEQRVIPFSDPDMADPLPEALRAMNGALQEMAVMAPLFAAKRQKGAYFRPKATVAVTGLTRGETTATSTWPTGAAGCSVILPGDTEPNRIVSISDDVAQLQFPYLGNVATGEATVKYDSCDLPPDVITVLNPVRTRRGRNLRPANGRDDLYRSLRVDDDYGRSRVSSGGNSLAYFIESTVYPGAAMPQLRMMLGSAPGELVIEYQARCSLGYHVEEHVFNDTPLVCPAGFVESLFLPLALFRFFGSSVLKNGDAPEFVAQEAKTARAMLAQMKPQGSKPSFMVPGI